MKHDTDPGFEIVRRHEGWGGLTKPLFIGATLLASVSLAGCANGINGITTGINDITGALSSPQANQAAANLRAGAMAVVCDVSSLAALDQQINAAIDAGQAIDRDANTIYVVSSALCTALGGRPAGSAIVPASAH